MLGKVSAALQSLNNWWGAAPMLREFIGDLIGPALMAVLAAFILYYIEE